MNDFGAKWHNRTIYKIASTLDSNFIFTSDECGNFKQIVIFDGECIKDYGKIFKCAITSMACSPDNKYVLVGDENGNLKQFDVQNFSLVHEYKKALNGTALC